MRLRFRAFSPAFFLVFASCLGAVSAQRPPNANPAYQQLRGLLPGGETIAVKDLEIRRGAATFTFHQGSFAFYGQVNGKVTGAVFRGDGHVHVAPPSTQERHNLAILTHSEEFDEDFDQVVLRFTDATSAELHQAAAGTGAQDGSYTKAAQALQEFMRHQFHDNLDLRLLEDVLSPRPGEYFFAAIHGKKDHNLFFIVDPHGAPLVDPEEALLVNWNDWGPAFLAAYHPAVQVAGAAQASGATENYKIDHEDLEVGIEKSGFLSGSATVHITSLEDGLAVVPIELYRTLRVSKVETDKGDPLDYVQENKDLDADFGVVLKQPLQAGESVTLHIDYAGKDVVQNEGNSNYYPVARESWYPNAAHSLGDYTTYQMTFHVPRGLQLIATGTKVSDSNDGKINTTVWKTDVPLAVVGFNLGQFTMKEGTAQDKAGDKLIVDAYANTQPPDMFNNIGENTLPQQIGPSNDEMSAPIGKINTASMLPVELSEAQVAAQIYSNYFGSIPFSKVAVTQQFACNYGQSWPMLVYLPICGFLDQTQQHFLGLRPEDMYWKVVTAHEVSHQWWGQTVGFRSYRDQWMSEGFAQTSASIFLQLTRPKPEDYLNFWKEQRKLITEKNEMGFRPIDVGPVTMGFRLSSERTGYNIYQNLVYPKGAYILHMIRMMMWSPKDGDAAFIDMMHDFVATYRLKAATTEDFKAMVEKHMTRGMDLEGRHNMDWFFREYVYGTDLPAYHFEGDASPDGDGWKIHFKLTQSGVDAKFVNAIPLYLELADGKILRLGMITLHGSNSIEQTVPLLKVPAAIKKVVINYNYDVLCTDN